MGALDDINAALDAIGVQVAAVGAAVEQEISALTAAVANNDKAGLEAAATRANALAASLGTIVDEAKASLAPPAPVEPPPAT